MATLRRQMLGAAALGAILALTPITAGLHGHGFAFAKDGGSDDDGGGSHSGSGNSGSGGSGGGGHSGSSNSGSGSSGSSDHGGSSNSGSGSSRGSDDHGGSGGSDDHGGSGGSGRGGADDAGGDDHGGGSDDRPGDDHGGRAASGAAGGTQGAVSARGGLRVVKFERTAEGVEVTYSNGLREEVSGGRFEQKDASGRTLIERPVTDADLKRIARNTKNSGLVAVPIRTQPTKVEASAGAIEVTYGTGWREELEGGRYQLKDPNNNTVIERPATAADVSRLRALAGG
ncbi:MAG: hypothetical protein U1E59_13560 [Amaricoccus sp.]